MPTTSLQAAPDQQTPIQNPPIHGSRRVLRVAFLGLLFCVGLFGTSAVFHRLLPFPNVPTVKAKIDWLAAHGDEYDTLFVGTSRTFAHIVPELFDRLMAEAGMPTHSFNLGVNGMRPPEDTYVLEAALAKRRAPLKLVVMEANALQVYTEDDQALGTSRAVYWHDLKRSLAVCRCTLETKVNGRAQFSPSSILWKLDAFRHNLNLFMSQTLSSGGGLEWLETRLGDPKPTPKNELGKRSDGYVLYDTPLQSINDGEWSIIQQRLAKLAVKPIHFVNKTKASQTEIRTKLRLIQPFGAQTVSFIPPMAGGNVFTPNPAIYPNLPIFNFADPARYPELFQRANRFDSGHLNQQGAEVFTRMLVEKIVAEKGGKK